MAKSILDELVEEAEHQLNDAWRQFEWAGERYGPGHITRILATQALNRAERKYHRLEQEQQNLRLGERQRFLLMETGRR